MNSAPKTSSSLHQEDGTSRVALSLPEEFLLMLLHEESGYFYQVPGWDLNCAVIGAVLADLSLRSRIDTDRDSLFVIDSTETGNSALDPILAEIANETDTHNSQYWIERLAPQAETIIDLTLERLVELKILEYHSGDFWTMARNAWDNELYANDFDDTTVEFVKTRIGKVIFNDEIPDPRDIIIISLINTCDVIRFIFQLDDKAEARVELICRMDLIARSIADAVSHSLAVPFLRRSTLTKKIPTVPFRKLLFNRHLRDGNISVVFADLAENYGPVFQLKPPLNPPLIFLAGEETNQWVHKRGRMYLRAKDYFSDFEQVYGASGVLPSLDGADHFRLRKSMAPAYSRSRLEGQLGILYHHAREQMASWKVGNSYPGTFMSRFMINAQLSQLMLSVDTQDIIEELMEFKERALMTHVIKVLPKFMLHTPGMRRRAKAVDTLLERVQSVHTPAQRIDCTRDLADDWLSLHASDPQFVPETTLRFHISAALVASVYLGDALSFALYAMASQPEIYDKIQHEADALFDNGDPSGEDFNLSAIDVTHRLLLECLRMYPIVPMSIRNVMNSCIVSDYELPIGSRIFIAATATHYMEKSFRSPFTFDIDRYQHPRNEHHGAGYAPYGLGTHTCLGSRWMELQLAINVLMVAHYFKLEVAPRNYKLKFNPIPSLKPSAKLKFRVAEQRRELPV